MYKTILLFALLILGSFSISLPDEKEDKVIKIALDNLSISLAKIPVGQENYYGFSNREEFKTSSVGKPYRVITFTNDFYNEDKLIDKNYILIQNEWRVPVTVNGENRLLLTVSQQDTTLEVVDLGGAVLAKELQEKDNNVSSGSRYLLRIYPLALDFFVKVTPGSSLADATYIPLASATIAINSLNEKRISKLTLLEVFYIVKQLLKQQSKN